MTYQVSCQSFAPGSWKWTGKEAGGLGMQIDGAFRTFAATVNAHPGNAATPLSVVRSHADATAQRWGYLWELGHPVQAGHLWLITRTPTTAGVWPQGETQSSSSMDFGSSLAERYVNNSSSGGYGYHSNSTINSTGLAYLDTTTSHSNVGAILLIAQDTTPGAEFFCWTLKTYGGNEDLHRDSCHLLYRSPASSGWCSLAVFPSTTRQLYGQVVHYGYSGNRFGLISPAYGLHAGGHQLRSGITLSPADQYLDMDGLLNTTVGQIQLPLPFFLGVTSTRGVTTHFGKVTRPDGVMIQLGQRSSNIDVWLWLPNGTGHSQASPWINPLSLSHWKESNELHFMASPPPHDLHYLPLSADFQRHFPPMSAAGTRQHPQQGPLLDPAGGGGGGSGGDNGGEGGGSGSVRPSTGLLWPRHT